MPKFALRMSGDQHASLRKHLFPGDGNEAVALVLCGRLTTPDLQLLCVHKILPVPHAQCSERTPFKVTWSPAIGHELFETAAAKSLGVLKIHSHPGFYRQFSEIDDRSDKDLFASLHSWTDDGLPHASAIMLPDGEIFGRVILSDGKFVPMDRVAVAGDDIRFWPCSATAVDEQQLRTAQAFGEKTTALLKQLTIGVVGCSGTGSWVIEQLARLGVGHLVLVDPDIVEKKNLNRIVNSGIEDARTRRKKVEALREAILRHGTDNTISIFDTTLFSKKVTQALAGCDGLFGCMDSIEGRDRLNRIATFYSVPYFDLGVRLDADGKGGIENISGIVNYLLPDGSSLLSRGAYSAKALRDDALRRTNPEQFEQEVREGYIKGAKVDSPAVISVNGFCASMAITEFLARIHPFRHEPNANYRRQQFDLLNAFWIQRPDTGPCPALARHVGRGDMHPLLNSVIHD